MGITRTWTDNTNWTSESWGMMGPGSPYDNRQEFVQTLPVLETGGPPTGPNDHRTRYDPISRQVYSWDPQANFGQGAWGLSGHYILGSPLPGDPNFNPEIHVDWATEEQYMRENYGDDFYI